MVSNNTMNTITYVIRSFFTLAVVIALAGCSGSGSNDSPTPGSPQTQQPPTVSETPTAPGTDPNGQTPTESTAGPVEPSGTTAGVWTGPTDFGTGVYIIDNAQNLFGLATIPKLGVNRQSLAIRILSLPVWPICLPSPRMDVIFLIPVLWVNLR